MGALLPRITVKAASESSRLVNHPKLANVVKKDANKSILNFDLINFNSLFFNNR